MSRVRDSNGLNLAEYQVSDGPAMKHEWVIVPSTSQFSWGSMGQLDYREKNVIIHDIAIEYNVSPITGLTGSVTNYPHYSPACFWATRVEILQNSVVINTIYPELEFLQQNLFQSDEKRLLTNNLCGNYASQAQRNALATTTSNYYFNLTSYFKQAHLPLLNNGHEITLRVYMDTSANQIAQSTLTGTPVSTINYCNLLVKVSRMNTEFASSLTKQITTRANHYKFLETKIGTTAILSGNSSFQYVLSAISGKVGMIWFFIRPTSGLTQDGQFTYTQLSSFQILNNSSTNIVGGQAIPASQMQLLLRDWSDSTFGSENSFGITNNNINVYGWSFCADPVESWKSGSFTNSYRFTSNEQLQMNFTSALGSNYQLDVYALVESAVEVGHNYVKKISL